MRIPAFVSPAQSVQSLTNSAALNTQRTQLTMMTPQSAAPGRGVAFANSAPMSSAQMGQTALLNTNGLRQSTRLQALNGGADGVPSLRRQSGESTLTMRAAKNDMTESNGVWVDDGLLGNAKPERSEPKKSPMNAPVPRPPANPTPAGPKPIIPPHDEKIWQRTNRIITALDVGEAFAPGSMDRIFESAANAIKGNSAPSSFLAKLATSLIDILQQQDDPQGKREYLYLMLKAADIMDETAQQDLGGAEKAPKSLYTSILLGQLDRLVSDPKKIDPTGLMRFYDGLLSAVLGDKKSVPYDALSGIKDRVLDSLGKEVPESLTAKVKLALYLAISIDTGQDLAVDELVEAFQDLGIPASKLAQTVGGQANNPIFADNKMAGRVLEACKILQQHNRPMTEKQALAQMAAQYEPIYGANWKSVLFKDIDFSKPYRTGTIAGTYVGTANDGSKVLVKLQKPDLKQQLQRDRQQSEQLLRALYRILEESRYTQQRLDRTVPLLLDQANLFKKSEAATNQFFERFEQELDFVREANAMTSTSCLTPQVRSAGPNAIIMNFVEGGITPFDYLEVAQHVESVDYTRANSAQEAVSGWLKSHYPYELSDAHEAIKLDANTGKAEVRFKDENIEPLVLSVANQGKRWQVKALTPHIDFSDKARGRIATQFVVDLIKQLSDGVLNCDAHSGNFLIAPGKVGKDNAVYNIDFGLTTEVNDRERSIAWGFLKGVVSRNLDDVARAYMRMTDKGRALEINDAPAWNKEVKAFVNILKKSDYINQLFSSPDDAMGPVMEYLAQEDFNIDSKYYALIRSFAGVASNASTMQNGSPLTPRQLGQLMTEVTKTLGLKAFGL